MLREKAKTPTHGDGYLEMARTTQEADMGMMCQDQQGVYLLNLWILKH